MDEFLVSLETPCVYYDAGFLGEDKASECYEHLLTSKEVNWSKTPKINRWVCLCHERTDGDEYKYRDAPGAAMNGFPQAVREIQQLAQEWYLKKSGKTVEFNVCLLNFYENERHGIGWHTDREELGRDTPIMSISLGATRRFMIRSKENGVRDRATVLLTSGSLTCMENICQVNYLHSVPKETEPTKGRINLTFRCKKEGTAGEEEHERRDNFLADLVAGVEPTQAGWSASPLDDSLQSQVFGTNVPTVEIPAPIQYVVKTNLGAEQYLAAELEEILPDGWTAVSRPLNLDGYAAVCKASADITVEKILLRLKSAHHVMRYHTHYDISECCTNEFPTAKDVDGERLYQHFRRLLEEKKASVDILLDMDSFRVSSERIGGPHAFQAPEIEREIGGALSEYYSNCKPKMQDYDVNVRADITGYSLVIGTQLNVHDLSKERHFAKFRNSVTIKTNIAYAMIRCANLSSGAQIVDPFCGSGTILLEALEVYGSSIQCFGMDVSRRSVDGARENAEAEGWGSRCQFSCSDARGLRNHLADESTDAFISNLPWGVRTGSKDISDLQTMYEVFLRTAWYVLKPKARIVMFVLRGLQLIRIVRKLGGRYKLLSVNVVRTANNLPCIVVIEKLPVDELRESVKGQLAHLNQYMSVSPEIYNALHSEDIDG